LTEGKPTFRPWITIVLALAAALAIEMTWDAALGARLPPPNLVSLIALGVATRIGPRRGALLVGITGLLAGQVNMRPDGIEALVGLAVGALAGMAGRRIVMDDFGARWFIIAALLGFEAVFYAAGERLLYRRELNIDVAGAALAALAWPLVAGRLARIDVADEDLKPLVTTAQKRRITPPEEEEER